MGSNIKIKKDLPAQLVCGNPPQHGARTTKSSPESPNFPSARTLCKALCWLLSCILRERNRQSLSLSLFIYFLFLFFSFTLKNNCFSFDIHSLNTHVTLALSRRRFGVSYKDEWGIISSLEHSKETRRKMIDLPCNSLAYCLILNIWAAQRMLIFSETSILSLLILFNVFLPLIQ